MRSIRAGTTLRMLASLEPLMSQLSITSHRATPPLSSMARLAAIEASSVAGSPSAKGSPSLGGTGTPRPRSHHAPKAVLGVAIIEGVGAREHEGNEPNTKMRERSSNTGSNPAQYVDIAHPAQS